LYSLVRSFNVFGLFFSRDWTVDRVVFEFRRERDLLN
jgi:hypothetical protein